MDILLNPNVAYALLVLGSMLAVLAILAPGTGIIELAGIFLLVLAGYAVYSLPINAWALGLLAVAAVLFVIAVRRPKQPIFLAASIVSLIAGSVFLFQDSDGGPAVDPVLAVAASTLSAGFMWFVGRKSMEAFESRPTHDLGQLIGDVGETKTEVHQGGSVYVAGELWSAQSSTPIPANRRVRVVGREGFILEVEAVEEPGSPLDSG